jgi:hypothetical protein
MAHKAKKGAPPQVEEAQEPLFQVRTSAQLARNLVVAFGGESGEGLFSDNEL